MSERIKTAPEHLGELMNKIDADLAATALQRIHVRDRAIVEACCRAVCEFCADNEEVLHRRGDTWWHKQGLCIATDIRAALSDLLKERS